MKKLTFIVAAAFIVAFSTSCSKEKDCTCTLKYTGTGSELFTDTTADVHITEGDCADMNTETTTAGITSTYTCVEK